MNWRGWRVVAALVLITTVIGGAPTAGLPALDKQILEELGISRADLKAREAILLLSTGIFGIAIGFLVRKVPPRLIAPAGLILLSAAFFAYAHATTITQIYGIYVVLGLCTACAHVVVVIMLIRQSFTAQRALATSIALTGTSIGSMVFAGVVVRLAEEFDWRGALNVLSVLPLVALVPAVALLRGARTAEANLPDAAFAPSTAGSSLPRTPMTLALLLFATFGVFFASNSMLLNLFLYMQDLGNDARSAANAVSLFFIVGLIAKFIVGAAAERWGTQQVWTAQQVILLLGGVAMTLAIPGTVLVGVALLGIGWAGCFVLTQVVIADYFSGPNIGRYMGWFIMLEAIAAGSGVWSAGLLFDVFGSYQAAFSFNCVLILLAIVATQWFARERRRVERYVASPPTRV